MKVGILEIPGTALSMGQDYYTAVGKEHFCKILRSAVGLINKRGIDDSIKTASWIGSLESDLRIIGMSDGSRLRSTHPASSASPRAEPIPTVLQPGGKKGIASPHQ